MSLSNLGWLAVRHRRMILALTGLVVVLSGAIGGGVIKSLTAGGFVDPSSESERARVELLRKFDQGPPNVSLLVTARHGSVDSTPVATEAGALTREVAYRPGVAQVWSYWSPGSPPALRSHDGQQGLILVRVAGDEDRVQRLMPDLSKRFSIDDRSISVRVAGSAEVARQAQEQIRGDLERAEVLSMPVLLVMLVLIFGSVVAAGLPLVIGAVSVVGTLLVLRVLASVTDVSLFAMNLTTALGLGLAIDYSLFMVARYREESRRGMPHEDAVVRAVETAGRTVLFSAVTVTVSLAALLLFPTTFLRSFAYAGMAVVALSAIAALLVLPALIAAVGPRLDRWVLRLRPRSTVQGRHRLAPLGFWHRLALAVMRRPVIAGGAVFAFLVLLGMPALQVTPGLPDHRVLPASASSRQAQEAIDSHFARGEGNGIVVVGTSSGTAPSLASISTYAASLSRLPDVARVDAASGSYVDGDRVRGAVRSSDFLSRDGTWLSVVPSVEALSPAAERLVAHVRSASSPVPVLVGGASAQLVDTKDALFSRLPLALGLIGAVTFSVLFLFTGGLLVGLKGLVLNLLSLSATFGAMVWVFQEGHLSNVLGFTATGTLDTNMPILLFCVVFGLSMDYEVFLMSRIKEHYDLTGDNRGALVAGLDSTGRLISAAAVLLAVVFLAFATSGITFIKLLGIGTALAVIVDATLVRGVLVPALMRLAGDANWWAPEPLRALHRRLALTEASLGPDDADDADDAGSWPAAPPVPARGGVAG